MNRKNGIIVGVVVSGPVDFALIAKLKEMPEIKSVTVISTKEGVICEQEAKKSKVGLLKVLYQGDNNGFNTCLYVRAVRHSINVLILTEHSPEIQIIPGVPMIKYCPGCQDELIGEVKKAAVKIIVNRDRDCAAA